MGTRDNIPHLYKQRPSPSGEGEAAFPIRQSWRIQKGKCRTGERGKGEAGGRGGEGEAAFPIRHVWRIQKREMPNGGKGRRMDRRETREEIEGKREEGIAGIPAKTRHTQETGNKEEGAGNKKSPTPVRERGIIRRS